MKRGDRRQVTGDRIIQDTTVKLDKLSTSLSH